MKVLIKLTIVLAIENNKFFLINLTFFQKCGIVHIFTFSLLIESHQLKITRI